MKIKVSWKKVIVVSTTSCLLSWPVLTGSSADVDIYTLCSKFPLNSRCEGYEVPISLRQRSGDECNCSLGSATTNQLGKCKIVLTDTQMTIYLEEGKPLDYLEGKKTTKEIKILFSDVVTLDYQTDTKTHTGRLVTNTLLFGPLGAIFTKPDKLAQIEIGLQPKSESNTENRNLLTIVTKRDIGASLKVKLEQLTGINMRVKPEG